MSDDNLENKKPQFELRDDGEIHYNRKGKSQLLAKYDEDSGILTFETFAISEKYRTQICRSVMEDWITGELTGNAVKAYAIAGRPVDKIKANEPLPPKKNKMLGDKTPEFVKWLFKWRPQAAYARYGVFLDSNGEPVTAHCFRSEQGLLKPEGSKPLQIGDRAQEALGRVDTEKEEGILASRATCLTFLKKEVIGYEEDDESENDDEPVAGAKHATSTDEEAPPNPEAEEETPAKKPAARRPARKPAAATVGGED